MTSCSPRSAMPASATREGMTPADIDAMIAAAHKRLGGSL